MSLTIEQVRHVAKLARLQMSEDEMAHMLHHLAEMIEVFDRLRQVDTEGITPTSHSVPVFNVWREDSVDHEDCREDILRSSISSRDGLFLVPAILEE